jgi:hypothetical protein
MSTPAQLRGYLLEQALAWLLRNSGYRLLVDESQDPDELISSGNGLSVKGRGAEHQADVLGEFAFTPAFSLPIRLFLEAKFTGKRRTSRWSATLTASSTTSTRTSSTARASGCGSDSGTSTRSSPPRASPRMPRTTRSPSRSPWSTYQVPRSAGSLMLLKRQLPICTSFRRGTEYRAFPSTGSVVSFAASWAPFLFAGSWTMPSSCRRPRHTGSPKVQALY